MAHIINKAQIKQRSLVIRLLDLKNAFGEVHHNLIQSVLGYHHIPHHINNILKLKSTASLVSLSNSLTQSTGSSLPMMLQLLPVKSRKINTFSIVLLFGANGLTWLLELKNVVHSVSKKR